MQTSAFQNAAFQNLFAAGRKLQHTSLLYIAFAKQIAHLFENGIISHVLRQRIRNYGAGFLEQTQQQMLRAYIGLMQLHSSLLGSSHSTLCALGKTSKNGHSSFPPYGVIRRVVRIIAHRA